MSLPDYPVSLPCPQTLLTTPTDRRQTDDVQRPRDTRPLSRVRGSVEQATFPPMTAAQVAVFRDWWGITLVRGAAWFLAAWPGPRGPVPQVRRFIGAPSWTFVAPQMWRVSAELFNIGDGRLGAPVLPGGPGGGAGGGLGSANTFVQISIVYFPDPVSGP